jgi:hypothetical protein
MTFAPITSGHALALAMGVVLDSAGPQKPAQRTPYEEGWSAGYRGEPSSGRANPYRRGIRGQCAAADVAADCWEAGHTRGWHQAQIDIDEKRRDAAR